MSDDIETVLREQAVIAVALCPDGRVVVRSCVSMAETAVWLVEVANEVLDMTEDVAAT